MNIFRWCDCYSPLVGRVLIGGMFLMAGIQKALGLTGTAGYIESVGLPFPLLLAVLAAILEIAAGLGLVLGYQARYSALSLAVFTLLASVFFHMDFSQQVQVAMFTKNLAIIGGLLYISTFGAGAYSIDSRKRA